MFPWMVDFLPCLHQSTSILDLSTFPWSVWREKRVTQYQALFKAWKKGPLGVFLEPLTWAFGLDFISQLRPENWRRSKHSLHGSILGTSQPSHLPHLSSRQNRWAVL